MKLRHLTRPLFESLLSPEEAAKIIASDEDLFDGVVQYSTENSIDPKVGARIADLIRRVKPFKPVPQYGSVMTLYRGEPEGTRGRPDKPFFSATADRNVAQQFARSSPGGIIKKLKPPYQAISLGTIAKWRMRQTGESHHGDIQAEWFVLPEAPLMERQLPLFRDIHIEPIDWDEVEIKPASEDIYQVADANLMADAYEVTKMKMWNLWTLLGGDSQDYYTTNPKERERVMALAQQIKNNGWFSPVIVAVEDFEGGDPEPYILEGQHRARAAQLLGAREVPGYGVIYFETE